MRGGIRGEEEGFKKYVLCPVNNEMCSCTVNECLFGWYSRGNTRSLEGHVNVL